jgi:hypothetical protein
MESKRAPPFRPEPARMLSVYDGRVCIGFLLHRGEYEVEAFDADSNSLGLFTSQESAAAAVSLLAHTGATVAGSHVTA